MRITIVGGGPVGLLTACLLSHEHNIIILEKRTTSGRTHGLNISNDTIDVVIKYLVSINKQEHLCELLNTWRDTPISTIDIEESLSDIATRMGVKIRKGITVDNIDNIEDSIIIGADGARSKIRELVFNNEKVDTHQIHYMAQLKYRTPGNTLPRKLISAMSYSFLNGLSGSDLVVDFESLAPPNEEFRKPGTLHIPIPESVYNVLSKNGRGSYNTAWTLEELNKINHQQVKKLSRIIKRYNFSLKWRGGWLEDPQVTVIPLTIYRSYEVVRILDNNKLVMLVGDSASGLIFERGLNKGFHEAVQCAITLSNITSQTLPIRLAEYSQYCIKLYESEKDIIMSKHNHIISTNKSTATSGIILTSGIGLALSSLFAKSL